MKTLEKSDYLVVTVKCWTIFVYMKSKEILYGTVNGAIGSKWEMA